MRVSIPYSYGAITTPRIQLLPNHSEAIHIISMPLQSGDMLMRVSIPYSYGSITTPRIQLLPNHSEALHIRSMPLQSGDMHSWWCSKKLFKVLPQKGWLCTPVMISEYFNQAEYKCIFPLHPFPVLFTPLYSSSIHRVSSFCWLLAGRWLWYEWQYTLLHFTSLYWNTLLPSQE